MNLKLFSTKKLKIFLTFSLLIGIISLAGFIFNNNSLTNYYYYKDKPMYLNLRMDKIFIKTKQTLTTDELRTTLNKYPQIASVTKMDANEKMQFIDLLVPVTASGIDNLIKELNQNPQIDYSSPVYSPVDGSGNKVLQGLIDEILVQFKPSVSENKINDYLKSKNLTVVQSLNLTGGTSYVLKVSKDAGMFSIDVANEVYNTGLVNWAEPNFYYSGLLCYTPNDVFYPRQWSIKNTGNNIPEGISGTAGCDMRVDSAWNYTLGTNKCIIGMVDSGIDTTHEDIRANIINSLGYDFINGHPLQTDDMNHGTCTGGIVAAVGNNNMGISGIAPNCKLIGIKIFNSAGSTTTTALTNGLIYSYTQGEWISSNSWGGGSPVSAADQAIQDGTNLGRAGKGTVFCFASGNNNGALTWPSTNAYCIAVGGNSPCNQRKSTTSCDGETWWGADYGTGLHIVSPCVKVYATDRMGSNGYTLTNYDSTFNGTSSATPNTAGVCALCLSLDSNQRWDTVRVRLCRTADKVGSYSYTSSGPLSVLGNTWTSEMGYGKVNAFRLLTVTSQMLGPIINHTPLGNTEQTTGSRAVTCIISPSGSGINPGLTRLYYRIQPTTTWTLIQLTNSSGTNWTGNITMSGAGTYNYYLTTTDSLSRTTTSPFGAPTSYYSFIASADTVKPVITTTPLPNTPKSTWPVTVTATVTDNIGVDSAWVRLYINTPTTVKRFKLTNSSGSTYTAPFNSVQADVYPGDSIFYRIIAQDISSNHNRDSTALYKFKIINQVTACIGTGTTSSNYPFGTYWEDGRTQLLYLSSEITAAGGATGFIQQVGFNVISVGGPAMNGFNIRMQNTSVSTISAWTSSNWTTCYSGTYTVASTGWQYITLTTPFYWVNGQNLLIEVCYNNNSWTAYSPVNASTATGLMIGYEMDLPTGDGCTEPTWTASSLAYRDNMCFVMNPGTSVGTVNNIIPGEYKLSQNYPNPFNPTTKIEFALPKNGFVSIKIYDVLGREVKNLVNETKAAGYYSVDFNATDLSSGVYFYKLESNGFSDIKRMMLIK